MLRGLAFWSIALVTTACSGSATSDLATDSGADATLDGSHHASHDATPDHATHDAVTRDVHATSDTGVGHESGATDAGHDAGSADAGGGHDGGTDAGSDAGHDAGTHAGDAGHDAGGGGVCNPGCGFGFKCCDGKCVNEGNDIANCGGCGVTCTGAHPYCNNGTCGAPPCEGATCTAPEFCCGTACCGAGMLCCDVPSGVAAGPRCTAPVDGTCPVGCPLCP